MLHFAVGFIVMTILIWFARWLLSADESTAKNPDKFLTDEANKKLSIDWDIHKKSISANDKKNVRNSFYTMAKTTISMNPTKKSWNFTFDPYMAYGITRVNAPSARDYTIKWLSSQFSHDELEVVKVSKSLFGGTSVDVVIRRKVPSDGKLSLADSRSGGMEQC